MTRSDSVDVKRWRAKYALIERAAESDKNAQALFAELDSERAARNGELREILADLVASSDLLAFKEAMNHWARKDGPYVGFGPIGSRGSQPSCGAPRTTAPRSSTCSR